MTIPELYAKLNASYEDAKIRLMNDAIIERFVLKFASDYSLDKLDALVEKKNYPEVFAFAHNLKGVVGNLSFSELFNKASALTEVVRHKNVGDDVTLEKEVAELKTEFDKTIALINAYKAEK